MWTTDPQILVFEVSGKNFQCPEWSGLACLFELRKENINLMLIFSPHSLKHLNWNIWLGEKMKSNVAYMSYLILL